MIKTIQNQNDLPLAARLDLYYYYYYYCFNHIKKIIIKVVASMVYISFNLRKSAQNILTV